MGWDVAADVELIFDSEAALGVWRASKPEGNHGDWPEGFVGKVRKLTVGKILAEWAAPNEGLFELVERGKKLTLHAWFDEDRFRLRGLELFAAFRRAAGSASGWIVFLGQGVDFAYVAEVGSGASIFRAATKKDRARGLAIQTKAARALDDSDVLVRAAEEAGDRAVARSTTLGVKLEHELARDLAQSADPTGTLLQWLARRGRGASDSASMAAERLSAGDRAAQARVLAALEPHIAAGKRLDAAAQLLLRSLGGAEPRARTVLLQVFRNPRCGWPAQLVAGRTLLSHFGRAGDAEEFGEANLPTLEARIDQLFPSRAGK